MRFRESAVALGLLLIPGFLEAQGAPVHPPFEGFTAGPCVIAPLWVNTLAMIDIEKSAVYTPASDTTSRLVADSVRVCANAFGGATSDEWQLLNFARLQLIMGSDAEAKALAQRYLRAPGMSSVERRAWALYLIASDHVQAKPPRFAAAQESVRQLDALGAPAAKARVLAHLAMAEAALRHWDDKHAAAEASAAVTAWKTLPERPGVQTSEALATAYILKAEIALRTLGPTPAKAIIDSADKTVPQDRNLVSRGMINTHKNLYAILGKPASPIDAAFWYGIGSSDGRSRPALGRVTLISNATHVCSVICRPQFDGLLRYAKRFGERLDIVNITRTLGYVRDSTPYTPSDEARYDSTHFLGKLALPGVLAVAETKVDWIADGRRRNQPTAQDTNYPFGTLIVVDKKGVVRYASTNWDAQLEEPIARFIESLIAER